MQKRLIEAYAKRYHADEGPNKENATAKLGSRVIQKIDRMVSPGRAGLAPAPVARFGARQCVLWHVVPRGNARGFHSRECGGCHPETHDTPSASAAVASVYRCPLLGESIRGPLPGCRRSPYPDRW